MKISASNLASIVSLAIDKMTEMESPKRKELPDFESCALASAKRYKDAIARKEEIIIVYD